MPEIAAVAGTLADALPGCGRTDFLRRELTGQSVCRAADFPGIVLTGQSVCRRADFLRIGVPGQLTARRRLKERRKLHGRSHRAEL